MAGPFRPDQTPKKSQCHVSNKRIKSNWQQPARLLIERVFSPPDLICRQLLMVPRRPSSFSISRRATATEMRLFLYLKRRMKQGKDRWAPDITNGQFPKKSIRSECFPFFFTRRPPSSGRVPVAVSEKRGQTAAFDCLRGL